MVYCGIATCDSRSLVLGRPLPGEYIAGSRDGHVFGARVSSCECLAPGTVGWSINDSELLSEPLITPAAVPDAGPLPLECGDPSAFVDLDADAVFYDEVARAAEQGITHGWQDGTYRPWEPIGRYAVAAFLYRTAGWPDGTFRPAEPVNREQMAAYLHRFDRTVP